MLGQNRVLNPAMHIDFSLQEAQECMLLRNRLARLEARLAQAEKEWADNPAVYKFLLSLEAILGRTPRPKPVHGVSNAGVIFKLQHDGLDDWRKRFLGTEKHKQIMSGYGNLQHDQLCQNNLTRQILDTTSPQM